MHIEQLALAVIHDPTTQGARAKALALFLMTTRNAAVLSLMQSVYAELDKPIYEGVTFTDDQGEPAECWAAADMVLQSEIDRALVAD
jgi:hypothetical protein